MMGCLLSQFFRHPELVSGSDFRASLAEILKQVQDDGDCA